MSKKTSSATSVPPVRPEPTLDQLMQDVMRIAKLNIQKVLVQNMDALLRIVWLKAQSTSPEIQKV